MFNIFFNPLLFHLGLSNLFWLNEENLNWFYFSVFLVKIALKHFLLHFARLSEKEEYKLRHWGFLFYFLNFVLSSPKECVLDF